MLPSPGRSRHVVLAVAIALLVACGGSTTAGVPAPVPATSSAAHALSAASPTAGGSSLRGSGQQDGHHPGVPAVDEPNHALTPGVAFAVGVARICVPGYASSVRDVSDAEKAAVYARYHVAWVPYQHEIDHLISLELGGSNAIENLWPEPYAGRWGARTKDVLENRLHDMVCAGELSLASAQHREATDWVAAYLRYVGTPGGGGGGSTSPGGYYASSYPTASTIYCADDPAWHDLSPTYLVHFATLAQAFARFPGYHLHQPC
ncbi:MAG: HNH endonuclease signature motif containing protein [Actinomycetota bacterium]